MSSLPGSLITPLEPRPPHGVRVVVDAPVPAQSAIYSTALRRIEAAVVSSRGPQHDANEDAHSALTSPGLFVVADGVGGGAMAQLASRQLVSQLHQALDAHRIDVDRVGKAMLDADRAIARRIAQVTDLPGAATVVLCAPLDVFASRWLVAWVGDCRVYRLATSGEPGIEMLTRDDTFRNLNEVPPCGGSLDDPARMVGNGATSGASAAMHDLACGDLLVLCSDGVHKHIGADDWCRVLNRPVALAQRCEELLALARLNGSTDDATVLLVQRAAIAMARPRWITRFAASAASRRADR